MVVAGRLSDRLGAGLVAPTLLLFAGAIVLPGLAHSVWWLGIALVAVGAASGALDVAINVAATAEEAASGSRFIQIAHALFSAGFLVAALTVGLARQAGADPLPVLGGTAALLAGVALLKVGLHEASQRTKRVRLTISRRLLILGLLCGIAFVVESGIENWSALFLQNELDASPAASGLGPGFFAVATVLGRTAGQSLEQRLGERRLLTAGSALAGVGLAVAAVAPPFPAAILAAPVSPWPLQSHSAWQAEGPMRQSAGAQLPRSPRLPTWGSSPDRRSSAVSRELPACESGLVSWLRWPPCSRLSRHHWRAVLYLFDGNNILHAGSFRDQRELADRLAGHVAMEGARGVVVFDGVGDDSVVGPLEIRYAAHADDVIERLAAEHRGREPVTVVSSDRAIRTTAGQETRRVSANVFLSELVEEAPPPSHETRSTVEGALDEETRRRLEDWRRRDY